MSGDGWVMSWQPKAGTAGMPNDLTGVETIQYELAGDPNRYQGRANELAWWGSDGVGAVVAYRILSAGGAVPAPATSTRAEPPFTGVGDVNGTSKGSGARFNANKPALELIPARVLARYHAFARTRAPRLPIRAVEYPDALAEFDRFQMNRLSGVEAEECLLAVLHELNNDGNLWADTARVFDYGRQKYSAWNWARGMKWSIPIGCALRHLVFGPMRGETDDPESGLPHRGHVGCNIVMLLWFLEYYPEGDDRPDLPSA